MANLERWRKRIELSRVKKENETKELLYFVYLLGLLLFVVGAFIAFVSILNLLRMMIGALLFTLGLGLLGFVIAIKNSFIRKIPLR